MDENLPPKEIAKIKREGRAERIRRIRKFVATGAVTLVALFSGVLLTRSLTNQTASSEPAVVAQSQPTEPVVNTQAGSDDDDHGDSDDDESHDDDHEDSDDDDFESTDSVQAASDPTTAPATAPAPTPVVTSQS